MSFLVGPVLEALGGAEELSVGSVGDLANAFYSELEQRTEAMTQELHQLAEEATSYMKQNAPWTDVTGRARQSLYCKVTVNKGRPDTEGQYFDIDVEFGYDDSICDYGEILETSNGGVFSIVGPTQSLFGPRIESVVGKYWGD